MMQRISTLEIRILQCLEQGLKNHEIAAIVDRQEPTIEGYIRVLGLKLCAQNRQHLIAQAYAQGVLRVSG
ncbi:MAG: LuxR C-terminal-related transcriptional regulator [Candidatus Eremiobacteraeota bacterium]|nr:LuxR C-terminal-related transcriptional regulator [Candidatus Eremiobacteraeota bacterium]